MMKTTQSVVADISLTLDDEVEIHYGWYDTEMGVQRHLVEYLPGDIANRDCR